MDKVCKECGKPLIKREHESKARFLAKKFDSSVCSRAYFKRMKIGWWSPESVKNKYLKNKLYD